MNSIDPIYLGTVGAAAILIAFCLNRFQIWERDTIAYDLTNLFGGVVLTSYAFLIHSIPFFILNAVWTLAVVWAFIQSWRGKKNEQGSH